MKIMFRDVRSGKRKAAITDLASIARAELEKTLDKKVKPELIRRHEKIVESWKNKPGFGARKYLKPDRIEIAVFPTGEHKKIWEYVDRGTKPHTITPKKAPYLKFQWGGKGSYVPKTRPFPYATVVKGGGYVRNAKTVRMLKVKHPGTEPRNFTKQIAENVQPDFKREVENAFRRAQRRVSE